MNDIKELRKLIKLCREQGVQSIRFDGVELHLGDLPQKIDKRKYPDLASQSLSPGGITADTKIITDELTDEQMLMWSVGGETQ